MGLANLIRIGPAAGWLRLTENIMARITVEDCLKHVENRFELVMVGSKRARQLATGGKEPFVEWENDKPTVVALREIEEGHVTADILNEKEEVDELLALDNFDLPPVVDSESEETPQPPAEE